MDAVVAAIDEDALAAFAVALAASCAKGTRLSQPHFGQVWG